MMGVTLYCDGGGGVLGLYAESAKTCFWCPSEFPIFIA